jgi:hypothetical protein
MKTTLTCLIILAIVVISGCGQSAVTPSATPTATMGTVADIVPEPTPAANTAPTLPSTTAPAPAPAITTSTASTPVPEPEPESTPTATPAPVTEPPPKEISQEDIDAARQVVYDYWVAFNAYDLDGVLSCLEESWRQESAESLESDMGRLQAFGTALGVSEEAEPVVTPDGKIEIRIKVKTPLGSRHVLYQLIKVNSDWKICHSEG